MEIHYLLSSSASCPGCPVTSPQNLFWLHPNIPFQNCTRARKKQPARDELGIRKRNIWPDLAFQALLSEQTRGWRSTIPHPSPFRSNQHSHPSIIIFLSSTTSLGIISILQMGKVRLKVLGLFKDLAHTWGSGDLEPVLNISVQYSMPYQCWSS